MTIMNVSLSDTLRDWVNEQTESGRYDSASDYLNDLIRRDQDRQTTVAELQQLVDEGLASGTAQTFDMDEFLKRKREAYAAQSD